MTAVDFLINSIKIFSSDYESFELSTMEPNCHGLALSEFQLGLLYAKYWPELTAELPDGSSEFKKRFTLYHMKNKDHCLEKAVECFDKAYEYFKKVNHLKGMHLAQKNKLPVYSQDPEFADYRELITKHIKQDEEKFKTYAQEIGTQYSCYIERDQGEEISVVSELVLEREIKNLFPIPIGKLQEKKINELPESEQEKARNEHKFVEKLRKEDGE